MTTHATGDVEESSHSVDQLRRTYLDRQISNGNFTEKTREQRDRLLQRTFLTWLDQTDAECFCQLSKLNIEKFRTWLVADDGYGGEIDSGSDSERSYLSAIKCFLRWTDERGCGNGLADVIELPNPEKADRINTERLEPCRGDAILSHLEEVKPYSRDHAMFAVWWHTGFRKGTIRSLDLDHLHPHGKPPNLEVEHRPDLGSNTREACPLKNKSRSERKVSVRDDLFDVLHKYIKYNRYDQQDPDGNDPLFTTPHGRVSDSTVKATAYRLTCPCKMEIDAGYDCGNCPDETTGFRPSECKQSCGPHAIRKGFISKERNDGTTLEALSHRCDTSIEHITEVYDQPSLEEEARRYSSEFR